MQTLRSLIEGNKSFKSKALSSTAFTLGIFAVFAAIPAQAQNAAVVLAPVSVAGTAQNDEDTSVTTVVIDQKKLEQSNPQDLKDMLSTEPGLAVGGAIGISQKFFVNGLEDNLLNVTIDGARQQNATFHHVGSVQLDPEIIKKAEIDAGIAPADKGPNALGGSATFVTKDARDFIKDGNIFGGYGSLSFDSNTKGLTENVALAARHDFAEVMVYGSHANGTDFKDGDGKIVSGTAPKADDFLGKIALTSPEGHRLKASYEVYNDNGTRPNRPNFAGLTTTTDERYVEYSRETFSTSYETEQPTAWFNPKLSYSYNEINLKLTPGWWSEIQTHSGEISNKFHVGLGTVNTGLDFYSESGSGGALGNKFTETSENIGAFAQARLSLTDEWRTSFGGRGDYQWFEGIEGTKLENFGLSGNVDTEYDVTPWLTPYAGYASVFGGIPMGETAIYNVSGIWSYDNLEPSRSNTWKLGAKSAFDRVALDGHIFTTRIDDAHDISLPLRSTTMDIKSRGMNLSAQYNFDTAFIRGTYSLTRLRQNDGIPTTTAAYYGVNVGHLYTLQAEYAWPETGVKLGTTQQYAPSNDELESNGSQKLKQYYVANVYSEWQPTDLDMLSFRLDVKNLFDRKYIDRANSGLDNTRVRPYYEPGRSFLATAKVTF